MNTKRMIRGLALIAILIASIAQIAQTAHAEGIEQEAGFRFLVGVPAGDFHDNVEDPGFGIGGNYGLRPVPSLSLGVGGDVMIYGSESRNMELPLVDDFELTTNNNLADFFCYAQYRPLQGKVQPYGEARFGYRYLWTESHLEDDDWWGDEVADETNYDDFTPVWAVGGGMMVQVYEPQRDSRKPAVWVDFKVMYGDGGKAEYLTEGAIELVDDQPVYSASESETNLTTWEVGVTLTF